MKVAILQPGYLPWLGFFEQMHRVDTFVLYNDVEYTKQDWRNRNRIKTHDGVRYLTVPVKSASHTTPINEIEIHYGERWQHKHLANLKQHYGGKAPYFDEYFPAIKRAIETDYTYLDDLDTSLIEVLRGQLGLDDTKLLRSSELEYERVSDPNRKLLSLCQSLGVDYLYEGYSAQNYFDVELFDDHGIEVEFQDYDHPTYPQPHGDFESHLSVVDLLFNCGPESLEILIDG
jgi:hypothetical protein